MPVEDRTKSPYNISTLRTDIDDIRRLGELHINLGIAGYRIYASSAYELLDRAQAFYGRTFDPLPKGDKSYEIFRVRFLLPKLKRYIDRIFNNQDKRALHELLLVSKACEYPRFIEDVK